MHRPHLQSAVAGIVLLGYLLVMAGTSVGQGWALLGHVATADHAPEAVHAHGGEPHASLPETTPKAFGDDVLHAHGDEWHRHDAPASDPAPVVLTLDKHRMPPGGAFLYGAPPSEPDEDVAGDGLESITLSIETPPPQPRS